MINMNKIKVFDNTCIKLLAISIMLFNHIGIIFFDEAPLYIKIGEIGFPLFAFCIAEGFHYTRDRKKYLKKLFLFALITELIFDYAFYENINWLHQNVLFTFSLSVLFLMIYEYINKSKLSNTKKAILISLVFLLTLLISTVTFADHDTYGVILVFIFYVFRDKPVIKYILATILLLKAYKYGYAVLSLPILMLYNGKKGINLKYFFYTFYPAHLLVLIIIRELIR